VPPADYEKNLTTLVSQLKATGAQLIWCNTTPVPAGSDGRIEGDEIQYNEAAARVMTAAARNILLIADDFGISEGVSDGIAQLGKAHRISGTSALVTLARPQDGRRLAGRAMTWRLACINPTLGAPLDHCRNCTRRHPTADIPARKSVAGRPDHAELRNFAPTGALYRDYRDKNHSSRHQHVHAPVARCTDPGDAVLAERRVCQQWVPTDTSTSGATARPLGVSGRACRWVREAP
jgi:hypothetical protein